MQKYEQIKLLGEGSYGRAILGRRKSDGYNVCIKEIKISQLNDKEKESKPAKTPADIIKNFKQNQEEKAKQQQEQAPVPPAAQQTPSQQPIQQVQTAPVPIPMAVPESLH